MEVGENRFTVGQIWTVAQVLGVPVETLFPPLEPSGTPDLCGDLYTALQGVPSEALGPLAELARVMNGSGRR